ncbi:fumarylacetoacetate hydrolase family protein [Rhodopirellula halodulae]|uniref:fumarylacetoacetate hydrolase family protein n=1 Tax=Rhodopirellula halodulae TaxID=2894198 RepID=UPI001E60E437|nr:fumarylacetoacetate hydrolase family protein [Rhodopirellula sp. JC737]MCC9654776.1 fumarylacetoacetate hydrolase family protein [Rhodopirellula sp. JC737]
MVAFCRYVESSGVTRLAIRKEPETQLAPRPKVCPIADLLDEATEQEWLQGNNLFALSSDELKALPTPDASQWMDAPATMLPPVATPEKILCIGLNYLDHAIETGAEKPTLPVVFSKFNSALVGHGQDIVLPSISDRVDYEAELVVVIGKECRHVAAEDAMQCVFGYAVGHDVSSRDWQKGRPGGQWLVGKSFDTFAPLGPAVVTADEIADPGNLPIRMLINGETLQDSNTEQLIFDIPALIAHLTKFMTLRPGDLIFTGTPSGVGDARTPPRYLAPGDRCVVEIDGIGRLENTCQAEA